jgi:predicted ATPase
MIKSLHVQNFRSLRDLRVDLDRRNILVGPNMSGKSNIIDLFKFLAQMVLPRPGVFGIPAAFNARNGFPEVMWKGGEPGLISISVQGDIPERLTSGAYADWIYKLSVLGNVHGLITIQEERLTVSGPKGEAELIERVEGKRVLKNADGRVLSHIAEDRSALEFEIPDWEGTAIRVYFLLFRFYSLIPPLMRQANPASAASFLNEHGENLSSWLMTLQTKYPDSFSRVRNAARDVFPDILELFTSPTQQATVYAGTTEKYLRRPIQVWQMSDGELTFIALLSLLFAPNTLAGSLYCVEEPENHLHPKLLETLIALHDQVRRELGPDAGQVILTTHSPQLVDLCRLDELIVVERREGSTFCTRPRDKSHLKGLLAREEIGLGNLFFSGALSGAE